MGSSLKHRADIQGLRAVAVILVIAGHLFPTAIPGGFIGVDVFFVISGFVITLQMIKIQSQQSGNFLINFYSRRIKRILPSALLVTAFSIIATQYYLGPVAANTAKLDGGWVTLFFGNFHFNQMAVDYFSTGVRPSVLQHYWSLSIEEQFYLLWPALFLLLMVTTKKLSQQLFAVSAIALVSLSMSLYHAEVAKDPIFFMTITRLWELGAGVVLALSSRTFQIPKRLLSVTLLVIIIGALFIQPTMQWPSIASLPIILCTLVVLANNSRISSLSLLSNKYMVYIGDLSYVLYLWHWPILTVYKAYVTDFGTPEKIVTILLTLVASALTHHLFENPLRFSTKTKPAVNILIGITTIAVVSGFLFTSYQG